MKLYEILDGNRKEKMFSCIYLWTNLENGKHYVGQATHFYQRMTNYKNKGATPKLQNAINKYGIDNFDIIILEKCNVDSLDEREQYWMDYYKSYESDMGYNISKYASTTRGCFHDAGRLQWPDVRRRLLRRALRQYERWSAGCGAVEAGSAPEAAGAAGQLQKRGAPFGG